MECLTSTQMFFRSEGPKGWDRSSHHVVELNLSCDSFLNDRGHTGQELVLYAGQVPVTTLLKKKGLFIRSAAAEPFMFPKNDPQRM